MFQLPFQTIRPATTAHLAQTMTMLSLTAEELKQQIESELASNPALELVNERRCPTCHRLLPKQGACPICSQPALVESSEPVVFISPRDDFYPTGLSATSDDLQTDDYSVATEDLPTYVLRQISAELEPSHRKLAAFLLTHLDEDGLLTIQIIEIARYFHVPVSEVEKVQHIIQRADPVGVGSCSTQEALLVQLDTLSETATIPLFAREIIQSGMDLLSRHQLSELAKRLKISLRQVQQAYKFISENLNPFPGRANWGDIRQPANSKLNVFHRPDIIISYLEGNPEKPLIVEVILPLNGTLRVNPDFKKAIREAPEENKENWKSDLERASLFVKCLQQRNHTIQRLIYNLVILQKAFIIKGEQYLKPITRVQLSKELEVHESTISRAVANKTVQLPNRRIIPLASFFDRSLNIRTVLCNLITQEKRPLSDSELVCLLQKNGYNVARRTVAKYRAMEGILPAHLRQNNR